MANGFVNGFSDELTKTAGLGSLIKRIRNSPELRKSILRSSLLGAGTGAVATAFQSKDEKGERHLMRNILGGAAGGAVTGAAFPGWFSRRSMKATDER